MVKNINYESQIYCEVWIYLKNATAGTIIALKIAFSRKSNVWKLYIRVYE